ncbi:hypothetical protein Q5H93_06760 [Hymenobacter sp. ASUV-10]|uniref:DUF11 domain-containing protein n=1 Tax=Hymenobacter aranciens TaxID=3063996 RepID=A0ABT9B8A7_9BACT|nr:hypothetical protein [Hymenobacter sp. ASUV-10]MDO7874428.1 hypothetical protein [Hymenobacter sp. ASUV-10]
MEALVHYQSRGGWQLWSRTRGSNATGARASMVRLFLFNLLLAGLALSPRLGWAQCATAPVTLDFSTRTAGENWKNRTTEPVPGAYSFTQVGTTYTSTPANADVALVTAALNGVQTLGWSADYTATTNSSTVTFNFSRAVSNLSIRVQDIDAVFNPSAFLTPSSGWVDEVTFTGANGATPVAVPTLTKVNSSSTFFTIAANTATGNVTAGNNTNPSNASVIATYGTDVTSITIRYRNLTAASSISSQSIGIDQISWCRIQPTAANVTTPTLISSLGQQSISGLNGTADGTPSYTILSVPANGTLQYNSAGSTYTAVTANQTITAAQAATLRYTPDAAFTGSSTSFTYRTTDDASLTSSTATYTIPLQYIAPCTTATNTLSFGTRPNNEDWKAHTALGIPAGSTVTTVSSGSYSASAGTSTLQIGTANSAALVWNNDYSGTGRTSSVTFTFNRAVSNFAVRIQDIDAAAGFTDVVTFAGANGASGVTPTLVASNPSAGVTSISGNVATGTANTDSPVDGTVTAYFPSAITTLTLTYANGTLQADPGNQLVGIDLFSFCRQAPLANNVTTSSVLTSAGQQPISSLSGTADGSGINSYTITTLPANGTLLYNSSGTTYTAVTANQTITAVQAATLRYTPNAGFAGSSTTFTYRAIDDAGVLSGNTATYTIPLQYIAPCATATNTLNFSAQPANEDWKARPATAVPAGSTLTTVSSGSYSASAGTSTLQIGAINGVNSLAWTNDYSGAGRTSSVTFTFNRAVSNFTVRIQDIDADAGFIDVVTFAGANGATAVTPTLVLANPGAGITSISGATATGVGTTTSTVDGTVTAYFPSAITTLTLTYANGTAQADPSNQAIGIDPFTWCRLAPTANNVTTAPVLSSAGQTSISPLSATADGSISTYTITSLPANGTLQYNSAGTTYTNVALNQTITAAQAATLRYTPDAAFTGSSTSFTYRATDDASLLTANTATYTIPLQYITPCTTATNTLDYSTRPVAEDWKAHAALAVPTGSALTTISTSGYANSAATTSTFQIGTANGVTDLVWNNDYSGAGRTSSVTFNFNRAVSNFTVRIQDIDADAGFIDVVTFAGANGATAVTPTLVLANPGAGITSISGNVATGQVSTSSTVDGTVTAYFPSAITSFTLTYANGNAAADPGNQLIGIETMTWCRLAPVSANITNTSRPSGQAATAINALSATADGTVASYTIMALPPAAQGSYFVNGVALTTANFPGLVLTPAQAAQLTFAPAAGFSGNAGFSYFATDNANIVSNTATYTIPVTNTGGAGTPALCATPGKDGSPTLAVNPDTYYPGTASAAAGATSITVGAGTIGGAPGIATSIVKGDLLLVIQMQGADISSSNSDAYGDGVSGGGASGNLSTNFTAGTYEYVTASNTTAITAASGGTITLASALVNSYSSAASTSTTGPRRFQVVRVPQFGNLTLGGTITPTPWNGSVGGILAIDVAGQTNFANNTINASARGFRGGGGRIQTTSSANSTDYVTTTSSDLNAQKGEGTAGNPRFVNVPTTPGDASTNALVDLTAGTYAGGSAGRGAPGNAGGGGNDDINNSGGGGGANGGFGGRGGNNFSVNLPIGGEPGASFDVVSSSRLVLGGGGGAGTSNDGTGTPGSGLASAGAAGGGIVLLRTGTITGTGTILANGGSANNTLAYDGSGGGGAGGSILVTANTPAGLANLTLRANGGTGGNNTGVNPSSAPGSGPHGPGGGGGGGVVLTNGNVAAATVLGGANGTTQGTPAAFGATAGANGVSNLQISPSIAGSTFGTLCVADVTTALTGPSTLTPAQPSGTYTATFTNEGPSTALNVTRTVTLPAGVTNILVNGAPYTPTTANTIDFGTASSLASGASSSFTFSFTPATTATGTLNITSNVGADSGQGIDVAANSSTIMATVPAVADVAASITASPAATAGSLAASGTRFTATFTNNGPTAAAGVAASVQLPAGLTNVNATNGGSYNSTTGLVTYAGLTSLANGATTTSVITFDAPANGPVVATANISTTTSQATQTANDRASASLTINPAFDLTTTLSGPASSVAGDLVTLAITTSNATTSPSAASTVVQTAQLPTGLTNVYLSNGGFYNATASATTVTYNSVVYSVPAGGVIYPPLATLPAGQSVANTVSFVMPATGFVPTATVTPNTSGAGETNTANNTAYLNGAANAAAPGATLTVAAPTGNPANVYTRLTSSTTTVAAGSPVTLTVTTGNNGSATSAGGSATGVVQMVQLLPGFTTGTLQVDGQTGSLSGNIITFSTSGATYNTTTGMLTFPAITQASGASVSHSIAMTAPANVGNNGQLLATAFVTEANLDPIAADNVASVAIGVLTATELATTVTGPATAVVGQPVTYTATFVNNGPMTAAGYNVAGTQTSGVIQTAQLPVGLSGVTITDASGAAVTGAAYNATTGLVTFPTLTTDPVGAMQVYNLNFLAPAQSLTVRSSVTTASPDGTPANNSASVATTISPAADLVTTVTGPATAVIGNPVTYVVNTTNNGPSAAASVVPTLQLPTGFTAATMQVNGQGGSLSGNLITFSDGSTYNTTTGLVTFASTSSLPNGNTVTNRVAFLMPNAAGGQLAGVASATSTTTDLSPGNNGGSVATSIAPTTTATSDLVATVTPSAASVAAGSPLTLTAVFTNNGPDAAASVMPTMQLPASLTGVTVSNGGTYNAATGLVTWPAIASQANGNVQTYTVALTAPASGPLTAVAAASSNTSEPANGTALTNNSASTSVTITPVFNEVTRLSGPATALPGTSQTYTVTTLNNGPSATANATTQTVTLPAGVTPTNITNSGVYSSGANTITWTIAAGQVAGANGAVANSFTITQPVAGATITASVTSPGESTTTDNGASITTTATNRPPTAAAVVNALQSPTGNTAANSPTAIYGTLISPLAASDPENALSSTAPYTIVSIPAATQGTLYYNTSGSTYAAATAGQTLTAAQAATLRFLPTLNYVGNAMFTYLATDNAGNQSATVMYTLPVGQDQAAAYTSMPTKGGANPYQNGDIITTIVDPNGARYNAAGRVYDATTGALQAGASNGLAATGTNAVLTAGILPPGVSLDPATGQLYVSNRNLLPRNATTTVVSITTTDVNGGVSTVIQTITLGAFPLPVELTEFTAQALRNVDGLLKWTTASEKNNDHFEVERSANGREFSKIGEVKGQGSKASPTDYALTDTNAAKLASTVYYRLKQVDADGTSSYSPVRAISFTKPTMPSISLWPNPAVDETNVDLSQLPAGTYDVSLLDATGRTIVELRLDAGLTHRVDLHDVANGAYFILVRGTGSNAAISLTKRLSKN